MNMSSTPLGISNRELKVELYQKHGEDVTGGISNRELKGHDALPRHIEARRLVTHLK